MAALILSGFGRVIGIFVGYGILAEPFRKITDSETTLDELNDMTDWNIYYKCIMVPAGVAFFASFVITPLSLIRDRSRHYDCTKAFKLLNITFCRGGILILMLIVYFIYYLGESLPSMTMIDWMLVQGFSTKHILAAIFTLACGVTLGYLLLIFWPLKKKFYGSLIGMGTLCLLLGLVTLQIPAFTSNYTSYVVTYMAILGVSQVMFETILRWVMPIAFSRQYIRWIEGLLGLMAGCATIINNFSADSLEDKFGLPGYLDNVFYLAGSAFLGAGLLSVIVINMLRFLKVKDKNLEKDPPVLSDRALRESRREREDDPRYFQGHRYR